MNSSQLVVDQNRHIVKQRKSRKRKRSVEASCSADVHVEHDCDPPKPKKRKNVLPKYVDDGFSYVYSSTSVSGVIKVVCKHNRRPKPGYPRCSGKASIVNNEYIVQEGHNHDRDPLAAEKRVFRKEVSDVVKISGDKNRRIFDNYLKRYPDLSHISFSQVSRTMRRHRGTVNPPQPQNLEEYGSYLEQPEYQAILEYPKGKMTAKVLRDTHGNVSVVLADRDFIKTILKNIEPGLPVFYDATFASVPGNLELRQILEIQGFAIAHVLMESKCQESYEVVNEYLMHEVAPELNTQIDVHMDFEEAERNALHSVNPQASITFCNFHFVKAIGDQAYKKKALKRERKNGDSLKKKLCEKEKEIRGKIHNIITLILALAFLPAHLIPSLFEKIRKSIDDQEVKTRMTPFLEYFEKQWLTRRPPTEWSVFKNRRRTNNAAESWNRTLHEIIGTRQPPWNFTRKLADAQNRVVCDYDAVRQGNTRSYCRWTDEIKETRLREMEQNQESGLWTSWDCLEQASNYVNFEKRYKDQNRRSQSQRLSTSEKTSPSADLYTCTLSQEPEKIKIFLKKI